jgi:MFS family permease
MTERRTGSGVFHGWKMVGALSVVLFFGAAGFMYVFPVFIESFQAEFGWSITQISSGAAMLAIVMGFSNPVVGALFARFGARRTMLVSAAAGDADTSRAASPGVRDRVTPPLESWATHFW